MNAYSSQQHGDNPVDNLSHKGQVTTRVVIIVSVSLLIIVVLCSSLGILYKRYKRRKLQKDGHFKSTDIYEEEDVEASNIYAQSIEVSTSKQSTTDAPVGIMEMLHSSAPIFTRTPDNQQLINSHVLRDKQAIDITSRRLSLAPSLKIRVKGSNRETLFPSHKPIFYLDKHIDSQPKTPRNSERRNDAHPEALLPTNGTLNNDGNFQPLKRSQSAMMLSLLSRE